MNDKDIFQKPTLEIQKAAAEAKRYINKLPEGGEDK